MNRSLRTRLLLGIGVTTAVDFLLTAVILYMQMRRGLLAEFNGKLTPESRVFHVMVKQDGYQIRIDFQSTACRESLGTFVPSTANSGWAMRCW